MSVYPPPIEITPTFNPNNFITDDNSTFITIISGDGRYLKLTGGTLTGALNITNTTQSTDSTTGALIVSGGVGIQKDVHVSGTVHVTGSSNKIRVPDGTVSLPSIVFDGDLDTGFYRIGTNSMGFSTSGVNRLTINTSSITSTLPYFSPVGSASAPAYSFGSGSSGMYLKTTDNIAWATNFTERVNLSNVNFTSLLSILAPAGNTASPGYGFNGNSTTGMYLIAPDSIGFCTAGILRASLASSGFTTIMPIYTSAGSVTAPSLSFSGDTNTGLYSIGADNIGVTTNGTLRLDVSTTAVTSTLPILTSAGSVTAPSLSFSGDTNTGLYSVGADQLGFTTGGTQRMSISNTAITLTVPLSFYSSVPSAESFYATSSSAVSAGAYTLLTGWTNALNSITYSSGAFTITSAGLYWISYTIVSTPSGATTQQQLTLFTINSSSPPTNARARQSFKCDFLESTAGMYCNLAVNDVIRFYYYSGAGGQTITGDASGNQTRCQIIRIG